MITVGVFVLRPQAHAAKAHGTTVKLPPKHPPLDASGARGWVWPDGTPGWTPTQRVDGFLVAYFVRFNSPRRGRLRVERDSTCTTCA